MLKIESGDGNATAVLRKLGKYERIKTECSENFEPMLTVQHRKHIIYTNLRKFFSYFEFDSKSQEGRNITSNS